MNADTDRVPASDDVGEATVRPGLGGRDRTTSTGMVIRSYEVIDSPERMTCSARDIEFGCMFPARITVRVRTNYPDGRHFTTYAHACSFEHLKTRWKRMFPHLVTEEELRKSAAAKTQPSSTPSPRTPAPVADSLSATESAATSASQEVNP